MANLALQVSFGKGQMQTYLTNFDKMPSFKQAEEEAKARIIPTLNVA